MTEKGHEVFARDPFEALVRAVGSLNKQDQTAMREALHRVLTTLAASGTRQHFGVCRDCPPQWRKERRLDGYAPIDP